jgi:hypothetical protein
MARSIANDTKFNSRYPDGCHWFFLFSLYALQASGMAIYMQRRPPVVLVAGRNLRTLGSVDIGF